jgi:hypothetical protein
MIADLKTIRRAESLDLFATRFSRIAGRVRW